MNPKILLAADIETTLLVAVWAKPNIFQGYFKITPHDTSDDQFIYFRLICGQNQRENFLKEEFYPEQFVFSHLYNQVGQLKAQTTEDCLYLLKYAVYITVTAMLKNKNQYFTYIDEIALDSMMERTALIINKPMSTKFHEDLGFSVVMNFIAQEKSSEDALTALLQLAALD